MKHLITIKTAAHGTISCIHSGRDGQYAEAGTTIILDWQPSAGWGLQEAHYTDADNNVVPIQLAVKSFTMPDSDIVVSGTFKRFVVGDWTGAGSKNSVLIAGVNGEVTPSGASIDEENKMQVSSIEATQSLEAKTIQATQSVSAGTSMSARSFNASTKITTPKLEIGDVSHPSVLTMYNNGHKYSVEINANGDGLVVTEL